LGRVASGLLKLCGRDPETEDDVDVWVACVVAADTMHEIRSGPVEIVIGFAKVMSGFIKAMRR
jgi:hypothetical protein